MDKINVKVCVHCNEKHARDDMCIQGMRQFISRSNRIKKVKPFSAKHIDKTFFERVSRKMKKPKRRSAQQVLESIDLTLQDSPTGNYGKNKKRGTKTFFKRYNYRFEFRNYFSD